MSRVLKRKWLSGEWSGEGVDFPSLNQMIGEAPKELLKQSDDLQEEEINI